MKFKNRFFICFVVMCTFLRSLQSSDFSDPKIVKQQQEDVSTLVAMSIPWRNAIEKYAQKNNVDFGIKCKTCTKDVISLGEFDGYLMALIIKAIPEGHDAFEKIKVLVDDFISLLSKDAPAEALTIFMVKTSTDMKQPCSHCRGTSWEKS